MLSFTQAVKSNLVRKFVTDSRAIRSEFWWFYLASVPYFFFCTFIARLGMLMAILSLAGSVLGLALIVCAMARRLHDCNMSAWWVLLLAIPSFGILILLVLMALPGTKGPNRFGPSPLDIPGFYEDILAQPISWKGEGYRPKSCSRFQQGNPFDYHQSQDAPGQDSWRPNDQSWRNPNDQGGWNQSNNNGWGQNNNNSWGQNGSHNQGGWQQNDDADWDYPGPHEQPRSRNQQAWDDLDSNFGVPPRPKNQQDKDNHQSNDVDFRP